MGERHSKKSRHTWRQNEKEAEHSMCVYTRLMSRELVRLVPIIHFSTIHKTTTSTTVCVLTNYSVLITSCTHLKRKNEERHAHSHHTNVWSEWNYVERTNRSTSDRIQTESMLNKTWLLFVTIQELSTIKESKSLCQCMYFAPDLRLRPIVIIIVIIIISLKM